MMKRLRWLVLFLAVITFLVAGVTAGVARAESIKLPLYKLAPVKTVKLACTTAERIIQIPIPERWQVNEVILSFDYVNSTGLMPGKSRMMVTLNNYPVSQINLNPLAPEGSVTLSIPKHLFEAGYNRLAFEVSQHYTLECEQPCAADLWTIIKLDEGFIDIDYDLKPVPLELGATNDFLFDAKLLPQGRVNIVMEEVTPELTAIAGIVASGIARRFDYKKVSFTTSNDIVPGVDNIFIGDKDCLHDLCKSKRFNPLDIVGPTLKIMHLPIDDPGKGALKSPFVDDETEGADERELKVDPTHALLIISGVDTNQLKLAAETLSVISSAYPNSDEMIITGFSMPDIPMYGGKLIVTPDKKYTFKTLNFPTHTFKGVNPSSKEFTFRLPADLLIKPNVYVDIALYFSYGAAMRGDSTLNVQLNGKKIRAIHLNNSNGDMIEGYQIRIPTYMFKPGDNTIDFEAAMLSMSSNNCENVQTANLFLTIYGNSTIVFPDMPHFAELPNLALFVLNGYPITRWPDGAGSKIYLTNTDYNSINAAFNILGLITQKNGYPLFEVDFTFDDPKVFDGELIIVGDAASIPDIYKESAPLRLTEETTVPYPIMRSWKDEKALVFSKQLSKFSEGQGGLMEFLSPYTEGRSVILLTAATTDDLLLMSEAANDPVVQSQVKGDLVLVDLDEVNRLGEPEYTVTTMSVGEKYISGKTGDVSTVDRYLYFYPWIYYLVVVLVTITMSLLLFFFLKRLRAKRHKGMSGQENKSE